LRISSQIIDCEGYLVDGSLFSPDIFPLTSIKSPLFKSNEFGLKATKLKELVDSKVINKVEFVLVLDIFVTIPVNFTEDSSNKLQDCAISIEISEIFLEGIIEKRLVNANNIIIPKIEHTKAILINVFSFT